MTIDKQALRQIAESVDREEWDVLDNGDADYQIIVSGSLERGATYRSYQPVTNEISNKKIAAFIAAFNPKVALALLDELCSTNGYASAYEAEKWHYHGLAESEGERADRAEKQVEELTMWIKRLAYSLRNTRPDSKLHIDAMDYLSSKGLISVEDVLG
ncbi:TPA: ead/Ea22-like family protein [Salmonella enterica subsp. houtenae serovar 43:z4,z32:-]|nr:ead/Ea22-like family protein [Salmonella enterica]ECW1880989.1 ead/Ea22-like family protein [Salmonella enterica]HCM1866302.1 ead/Ea22-like family protein [Salmonella enterica subsp. houtenae serovar 43:z4,z32:-]